jgi:3-phenylpropionate/trans-cinnamate dioxygenase ferredoxin subunit
VDGPIELGDLGDLRDGELRSCPAGDGRSVLVCRVDGRLYAVEDNCSHRDTPLSQGRLRGAIVTCPLHGARFDVRDGSHLGPPAFEGIATYSIDEHDGVVVVARTVVNGPS